MRLASRPIVCLSFFEEKRFPTSDSPFSLQHMYLSSSSNDRRDLKIYSSSRQKQKGSAVGYIKLHLVGPVPRFGRGMVLPICPKHPAPIHIAIMSEVKTMAYECRGRKKGDYKIKEQERDIHSSIRRDVLFPCGSLGEISRADLTHYNNHCAWPSFYFHKLSTCTGTTSSH